jgi:glycosyltransferase involved in cell wall biosynthesis
MRQPADSQGQAAQFNPANGQEQLIDQNILCFAPNPWDGLWRNRQQLMSRLACRNTVLYVEPQMLHWRKIAASVPQGQISLPELVRLPLRHIADKLYVYSHPYFAPTTEIPGVSRLSKQVRSWSLRTVMRRLNISRPILWLYRPEQGGLIGQFDEALVCYHVVDSYSGYTHLSETRRAELRAQEKAMLAQADVVIATSDELYQSRRADNQHTYLVRNAVDYAAFSRAVAQPAPPDVAALPHPIIGYVGALNGKLDYSLLEAVAEARPAWSLVLVGPPDEHADLQAFKARGLANVHFLGRKPVNEVANYIHACDVCLLPYQINEWTRHIDALKLYEYLACGKPVVSTDIPTAHTYPDTTRIAADADSFVQAVEEALIESRELAIVARQQAVARQNTWDHRVAQISQILMTRLGQMAAQPVLE